MVDSTVNFLNEIGLRRALDALKEVGKPVSWEAWTHVGWEAKHSQNNQDVIVMNTQKPYRTSET